VIEMILDNIQYWFFPITFGIELEVEKLDFIIKETFIIL
jgi:hypothetical protein